MGRKRLIMIAGWAHTKDAMAPLATFLAREFEVKTISVADLLAAGRTEPDRSASPYALGLRILVERQKAPCAVVGWSMGGIVALEAIVKLGLKVERLAAIASTPRFCSAPDYPFGLDPVVLRAFGIGLSRNAGEVLRGFLGDMSFPFTPPRNLLERQVVAALALGMDTLAHGLKYLEATDLRSVLACVGIPVLALHGKRDRIVPWQAGEFMANHVTKGKFIPDDEAGHTLPLTHPDVAASNIRRFMRES
jgi:pimeloyl-[acyl-carrier protein] methyl ester esterase